jgi:glycosyltransferase involved in cell wall biosynthesis
MKIVIIVRSFLNNKGFLIPGGIETYTSQLCDLFSKNYEVLVYQMSSKNFEINTYGAKVIGQNLSLEKITAKIKTNCISDQDIVIITSEQLDLQNKWNHSVVIQHGVYWDLPVECYTKSLLASKFQRIYKIFDSYRNLCRITRFKNVVCVDYSYMHWLRMTLGKTPKNMKFWVIPNHADNKFFALDPAIDSGRVGVLFARRFMRFRGTTEMCEASKRLISKFSNVYITICGEGPEEAAMKKLLPPSERVHYTTVDYTQMPAMISNHHIVVIPSLGSEGTSLSAIEAMAAERAVVASSVGGMTDIIFDGFNGILVYPGDSNQFFSAIAKLIECEEKRKILSRNARTFAAMVLNKEKWERSWKQVLKEIG